MTIYFIKVILCSAMFFAVYKLLFENEKMLRFNRFYLLVSIVFSFIVPLITIRSNQEVVPAAEMNVLNTNFLIYNNTQNTVSVNNSNTLAFAAWSVYVTITLLLLSQFCINLKTLISKISNNPVILFNNAKLVLINQRAVPHSFLNCIFANKEDYNKGKIEREILLHELTHVRQKHSIDVLFIELVQAIFWFNPVFIFYRKAIQLNHEFLADDSVINIYQNTYRYQNLLLEKASRKSSLFLTNPFNYSITKKRLVMITKTTSARKALGKTMVLLPLFAIAIFLFAEKGQAQDSDKTELPEAKLKQGKLSIPEVKLERLKPPPWVGLSAGSTKEGVSQELLSEYEAIVDKYKTTNKNWWQDFQNNVSKADRDRLETIFKQMNEEQQSKQTIAFTKPIPPLPKVVPANKQLESWKNPKIYGVWIDGKKVNNAILNNYTNTDFSQVFVSKLYGAAKKNVRYFYQVDLMTKEYYQKYYEMTIADKGNRMVFGWFASIVKRGK